MNGIQNGQQIFINGYTGPYNPQFPVGIGANAGFNTAQLMKNRRYNELSQAVVQYTVPDQFGRLNIDSALAFTKESSKALTPNSVISKDEFINNNELAQSANLPLAYKVNFLETMGRIFDAVDLNKDGKVSNAENTAYTIFQDCTNSTLQGVTTPQGRLYADQVILSNPDFAKSRLTEIYNDHNLAARDHQLHGSIM